MSRSERRVPKAGISVLGLWDFGSLICWTIYSRERLLPTLVRLGPLEPPSPLMVWHSMHFPLWKSCEPRDSHPVNMIRERKGTAIHVRAVLCFVVTGTSKKGEVPHVDGPSRNQFNRFLYSLLHRDRLDRAAVNRLLAVAGVAGIGVLHPCLVVLQLVDLGAKLRTEPASDAKVHVYHRDCHVHPSFPG